MFYNFNKINFIIALVLFIIINSVNCEKGQSADEFQLSETDCDHTLSRNKSSLMNKIIKGVWPFRYKEDDRPKMRYFLYKSNFSQCGRELFINDDQRLKMSGFDPNHPTRILIHGWLTGGRGAFSSRVASAYLNLTNSSSAKRTTSNCSTCHNDGVISLRDFNIIVVDWSGPASNLNYFRVIKLIDDLGFLLAELLRYLHLKTGLHMNNVYLIGHSLGSHIAGSTGKQLFPHRINTIYALDPAGPRFRHHDINKRLDITDADYIESIQTSSSLGFYQPIGHATFFVNFGAYQSNCYKYGCSHSRAYHYFSESLTSNTGFWGIPCYKDSKSGTWILQKLSSSNEEMRMGGEPSISKNGTFYVKTNKKKPYAKGKNTNTLKT